MTLYKTLRAKVYAAIARCTKDHHPQYSDYGGRGIRVHAPWLEDKEAFITYLTTLEGHDDPSLVLDRKDNDGHYEPGNLEFVTRSESQYNRRERRTTTRRRKYLPPVPGTTFGEWTVIGPGRDGYTLCRCSPPCLREREVPTARLLTGLSTQCPNCSQAFRVRS